MGYDTSYHPVDVSMFRERILPFIMGEREIDDLITLAVERERVRHRAKAWALGLFRHKEVEWFDSQLHVWGRPFLILSDEPSEVAAEIDTFLGLTVDQVDDYIQQQIASRQPGLSIPDAESSLPDVAAIAQDIRWKLELFRSAYANLDSGQPVETPDGDEHDPQTLLRDMLGYNIFDFAARFTPGWMERGYTWPTYLFSEAGLSQAMFTSFEPVLQPIYGKHPELAGALQPMIVENYCLGGYVPPERVQELWEEFDTHESKIVSFMEEADWGDMSTTLKKLREAIYYAANKGLGFVEATEIYSGPMGVMN